jgi:hypothetical protein
VKGPALFVAGVMVGGVLFAMTAPPVRLVGIGCEGAGGPLYVEEETDLPPGPCDQVLQLDVN